MTAASILQRLYAATARAVSAPLTRGSATGGRRSALSSAGWRAAANSSPRPVRSKTTSNVPPRRTRIRPEKSMAVGPGCSITPADDQSDRRRSCARTDRQAGIVLCAQVLPPSSNDPMKSVRAPKPKSCCHVMMMFGRFAGLLVIVGSISPPVIFRRPPARRDSRLRRDSGPDRARRPLTLDGSAAATASSGTNYQEEHDHRSHGEEQTWPHRVPPWRTVPTAATSYSVCADRRGRPQRARVTASQARPRSQPVTCGRWPRLTRDSAGQQGGISCRR